MKFTRDKARKFGWEGIEGWAYISKDDFPNMTCSYIVVTGVHGKIKSSVNDRIYYIIRGEGEFVINDRTVKVRESDVIVIPRNTAYDYRGNMEMLLVNSPAFEPDGDIKLISGKDGKGN